MAHYKTKQHLLAAVKQKITPEDINERVAEPESEPSVEVVETASKTRKEDNNSTHG